MSTKLGEDHNYPRYPARLVPLSMTQTYGYTTLAFFGAQLLSN